VSHSERNLRRLCKRGNYLRDGSVAADGPIDDVLEIYDADSDRE
jgi:ABC-2 type transport system ATP-binding protein